jgi:GT2 family glycosyltransferase
MRKPFVSVLIDTCNHERFIEQAIVSVLEQDFPAGEVEILVVDDGSTDRTPEIVRQFAPRVRYLRKENGGQASAFNVGIPQTRGEIVAFLDGDDWWAKTKLTTVVEQLDKHPEFGAVGHGIIESYTEAGSSVPLRPAQEFQLRLSTSDDAALFSHLRCFLGTSRFTARRSLLEKILPVPEELIVEADEFLFTLAVALGGAMVLQTPLTHYRLHGDNLFQFRSGDERKLRRKRDVMACLVRTLPQRLRAAGLAADVLEQVILPVWVEAERLRLTLGEGTPFDTFRLERASNRLAYRETSLGYRAFKAAVLLSTLVMPPKQFYRAKTWYAERGLRRMRRVLGEPTQAAPISVGEVGATG